MPTTEAAEEQNHVFLHPQGYIEVMTVGVQSPESVIVMGNQIAQLATNLRLNQKPVLVLDNLTKMALKQPSIVPKTVAAVARRLDFDKVAMLGGPNRFLKYGSRFMIRAIGKGDIIQYFTDRSEAENWLLQPVGATFQE